ncbi:MAG: hypothetical protein KDD47_16960 [Acidobacteria bacterium]|nr:hypothetical protein [Acidobacteriota bacterium]
MSGPGAVAIGVDIGQQQDPTAICVAETEPRGQLLHYRIRHLERLPLGTSYPRVADRIRGVAASVSQRTGATPAVFVDATGVGAPVMDLLRQHTPELHSAVAVLFTSGSRRREHRRAGKVTLGKARMVGRLQALLQAGRIHLPNTQEAQALARELQVYELRVDGNGRARFGAFKTGTHDDLATALGLAIQFEPGLPRRGPHG